MGVRLARWAMRLFFRLLYNQMAWTYDGVAWLVSFGQWKAWGQTALPHLRGQRILELAHGPGHLMVRLQQGGWQPVGLDLSPYMGQLARRRLGRAGLAAPLVRARAQAMPFCDGAFDSAVSTFPTEFIADPGVLREAARVLNARGRLVIVPGVIFTGRALPNRLLKWLYTITGQSDFPPRQMGANIADAGLSAANLRQNMGMVDVLVIVAEKAYCG